MAQPDDYIADRVWSDIDMDLRPRAWQPTAVNHPMPIKSDPSTIAVPTAHPPGAASSAGAAPPASAGQLSTPLNHHHLPVPRVYQANHYQSVPQGLPPPPPPLQQQQQQQAQSSPPPPAPTPAQPPHLPVSTAATPPPPPLYPAFSSIPGSASLPQSSDPRSTPPLSHLSSSSSLPLVSRNDSYLVPLQNYSALAAKPDPSRWARQPLQSHAQSMGSYLHRHQSQPGLPPGHYPPAYTYHNAFVPMDNPPHANSDTMERALRDVSVPSGSTATTSDSLMQARASGVPTPIPSPLSDAERLPGTILAPEHAVNPFVHVDTVSSIGARGMMNAAGMPGLNGICKTKQRRRYAKPKSSRYCHLCARHERAVTMYPCGNVELGICQKSVCAKCFDTYGLDLAAAKPTHVPGAPRWTCPHCNNNCPKKAKCHSYDRQTERRRMKTRELKRQLALKMETAASAS